MILLERREMFFDERICDLITSAVKSLYANDLALVHSKGINTNCSHSSEMSIVFRIGLYMHEYICQNNVDYDGFVVDNEYNRNCGRIKELGDEQQKNVYRIRPDLIVHKRCEKNNLLVIEIKIWWNSSVDKDIRKVRLIVEQFKYRYGLVIKIAKRISECEFYFVMEDGEDMKFGKDLGLYDLDSN